VGSDRLWDIGGLLILNLPWSFVLTIASLFGFAMLLERLLRIAAATSSW
jgi:hypothetical protein